MKVKRLRSKVTGLFLVVVLVAVLATLIVTSRAFVTDKQDYIMDVAAVVAPSIASGIGKYFDALDDKLLVFDDILTRSKKEKDKLHLLQSSFSNMNGAKKLEVFNRGSSILILTSSSENVTIKKTWLGQIQSALKPTQNRMLSHSTSGRILLSSVHPQFAIYATWIRNLLYVALIRLEILNEYLDSARGLNARLVNQDTVHGDKELVIAHERVANNQKVLSLLAPIPNLSGSAVYVEAHAEQITKMLAKLIKQEIPFLIAVLFIVIFMGILFSRNIVMPIEDLTRATKEIARGRWAVDLKPQSSDELGRLMLAFSNMGSELETREQALQRANAELVKKERLAVLGQFGAGIAHEVKNPLNSILGYAQLLQRNLVSSQATETNQKYLGFICDETRRASRIITDLLTFAKQRSPILTTNNLCTILNLGCEMISPNAETLKVQLIRNIPASPIFVNLDKDQFFQVLLNLATNAFHAMADKPENSRHLTIMLEQRNQNAVVTIQDVGCGIPKENLPKLFEPFFTTKKGTNGTGLGLSMCHGIIVQHKGQLEVDSQLGVGTIFRILLPIVISG